MGQVARLGAVAAGVGVVGGGAVALGGGPLPVAALGALGAAVPAVMVYGTLMAADVPAE